MAGNEVCRKTHFSAQTLYRWKKKCAGVVGGNVLALIRPPELDLTDTLNGGFL